MTGKGFPAHRRGSVWAQSGSVTAQKTVWTTSRGTFKYDFSTLSATKGNAIAKAWIGRGYAKGPTNFSKPQKAAAGSPTTTAHRRRAVNSAPTTPTTAATGQASVGASSTHNDHNYRQTGHNNNGQAVQRHQRHRAVSMTPLPAGNLRLAMTSTVPAWTATSGVPMTVR